MIFMNFFSRSSRATGPKTRVPTGSPSGEIRTAPRPHDDRPHDALAVLLDEGRIGRGFLDGGRDDVPQARVLARRASSHADAGDPARPRIVRNFEDGAHLNHRATS